jgi:hypothetical protein
LEGPDRLRQNEAHSGFLRTRAVFLTLLPVLFLGTIYFLLVEYALHETLGLAHVMLMLRIGGGALIVLFLVVALGCGLSIHDHMRRPMQAIQHAIDGNGFYVSEPETDLPVTSDPEVRRLLLRVRALVQQNRAGAQALSELDAVRVDKGELAEALRKMREDLERLREDLGRLAGTLGQGEIVETSAASRNESLLADLERLATVWSLQIERARRDIPQLKGDLGSCYRDFSEVLERLRVSLRAETRGEPLLVMGARSEVVRLQETISGLLKER